MAWAKGVSYQLIVKTNSIVSLQLTMKTNSCRQLTKWTNRHHFTWRRTHKAAVKAPADVNKQLSHQLMAWANSCQRFLCIFFPQIFLLSCFFLTFSSSLLLLHFSSPWSRPPHQRVGEESLILRKRRRRLDRWRKEGRRMRMWRIWKRKKRRQGGGGKRKEKFANARSLQKSREFPLISNVNSFPSAHKNPLPSDVAAFLGRDLLVVVYSIHPCSWEERKTGEKRFYFLRNRRRRRQQKKAGCNLICWGSRRKIDDRETPSVRPPHIRRRRRLCEDLPEGEGEEKRGEATTGTAKLRPWRKWWEKK